MRNDNELDAQKCLIHITGFLSYYISILLSAASFSYNRNIIM